MQTVLVTGGAGFIGSAVVRGLIGGTQSRVVNVDALTYAGNLESLAEVSNDPRYTFEHADIGDADAMRRIFAERRPDVVIHLAAESHVDRSIDGPDAFIRTNVLGTFNLLEETRRHWLQLNEAGRRDFRFVHVSTDEVFGSLGTDGRFEESTPYAPTSPYSASKAASDHLVRAWSHTYGLPTIITNCSNNYGPYQFPEKLIPLMIEKALAGEDLPVYGTGDNVRDWLFVDDHARALLIVAARGVPGETYLIGGRNEKSNLETVRTICALVEELAGKPRGAVADRIRFVKDRPGHDHRYAIDADKIQRELGWTPLESFETGLRKTVSWYLENRTWVEHVRSGEYKGGRLGVLL